MTLKLTSKLIFASVFVVLVIFFSIALGIVDFSVVKKTDSTEQTLVLKQIENIGKLELVKFNFNDVMEESIIRKLFDVDNLAPDSRVLLLINGEAAACVDLEKLTKDDIISSEDSITIFLPQPEICYSKINHERSKIYDENFVARVFNPELIDKAYKNAEIKIKSEAINLGILVQARQNAKKIIGAFLRGVTKKKVIIEFKASIKKMEE
ncbi:MAG TPA: DUF4230 domain-containing protein [Ignavibacteriaceae bacterium]|nr:DUF4230 domain-containing protein [Ignavibacteriaceae bacterium]